MKTVTLATLALTGIATAQTAQTPVPATEGGGTDALALSRFSASEEINFFNLQGGNVTQFLSTIDWDTPIHNLSASLTMPVYTDGNTGAGMLDLGAQWVALESKDTFVDTLTLTLDVLLPTSSAGFGGTGVNPVVGAQTEGQTGLEGLQWNAGAAWQWNTSGNYIPVFGGFTEENILSAEGGLSWAVAETLQVQGNYGFWYLDNGSSVNTVGPALKWTPCHNAELGFRCDIPFSDTNASDLELIVGFSAGIKF
jgi:hypothetical protein